MPGPGDVFYLPPDAGEDPHKGDRPHILLSVSASEGEVVTLAYGSTRSTDALRGAEHVFIDPHASPGRSTGLIFPTYVYPSRLVSYAKAALGRSAGRIDDELPRMKESLGRALGLGSGVTGEPNVQGSNRRGRFVEFAADLRRTGVQGTGS